MFLFVSYRLPLFSHHSDCFGTTDTPSRSSCGRRRRREGSTGGGFRTRYNYSASDNSSANTWHISPLPSSYLSSLFLCLSINTRLSFLWGQAHMISSKNRQSRGVCSSVEWGQGEDQLADIIWKSPLPEKGKTHRHLASSVATKNEALKIDLTGDWSEIIYGASVWNDFLS